MNRAEAVWLTMLTVGFILLLVESLVARWRDQQLHKRLISAGLGCSTPEAEK